MNEALITKLAYVNPPFGKPVRNADRVSFISMSDVSERGGLKSSHSVLFGAVKIGFTRFQDGDVLFAKITPCMENGKGALAVGLESGLGCGSTEFHVLRAKDGNSGAYIYQLLQSVAVRQKAEAFMSGSAGQRRVPSSFFTRHTVFAPKPAIQKKIAAILTSIDTAIEKTEALIAKYQQIKAGLMHDLFTRGVLPNGQLRPPREQAPELYQETVIGWIPRAWRLSKAGSLCSLITKGTTPASADMWESSEGIRFLRVDNLIFDGRFDFTASSYRISDLTHNTTLSRSKCFPGDVLMNIVGPPLGKVSLVTPETGEVNINQAIAVFRPTASLSSIYLLRWLLSTGAKRWLRQRAKQTSGQLNLTLAMCQELDIPLPSIDEQGLIEMRLQTGERLVQSEMTRLSKLQTQKLGLMQDLLTGKVQVKVHEPTPEPLHA